MSESYTDLQIITAKNWWRGLCLNEMKDFAKIHLSEGDRDSFMNCPQHLSRKRWDELHVELWLKAGQPSPRLFFSSYHYEEVHISTISSGDTVIHNEEVVTVGQKDIHLLQEVGHTLFGDSYRLGQQKVKKVLFHKPQSHA